MFASVLCCLKGFTIVLLGILFHGVLRVRYRDCLHLFYVVLTAPLTLIFDRFYVVLRDHYHQLLHRFYVVLRASLTLIFGLFLCCLRGPLYSIVASVSCCLMGVTIVNFWI
jgi:hypothetical protein